MSLYIIWWEEGEHEKKEEKKKKEKKKKKLYLEHHFLSRCDRRNARNLTFAWEATFTGSKREASWEVY